VPPQLQASLSASQRQRRRSVPVPGRDARRFPTPCDAACPPSSLLPPSRGAPPPLQEGAWRPRPQWRARQCHTPARPRPLGQRGPPPRPPLLRPLAPLRLADDRGRGCRRRGALIVGLVLSWLVAVLQRRRPPLKSSGGGGESPGGGGGLGDAEVSFLNRMHAAASRRTTAAGSPDAAAAAPPSQKGLRSGRRVQGEPAAPSVPRAVSVSCAVLCPTFPLRPRTREEARRAAQRAAMTAQAEADITGAPPRSSPAPEGPSRAGPSWCKTVFAATPAAASGAEDGGGSGGGPRRRPRHGLGRRAAREGSRPRLDRVSTQQQQHQSQGVACRRGAPATRHRCQPHALVTARMVLSVAASGTSALNP